MSHPIPKNPQHHAARHVAVDVIEDVEFMVDAGETHIEALAVRVGMKVSSLESLLYTNGRPDLGKPNRGVAA